MALATYYQRGETVDYKNTTNETIKNGTVIDIGTRIGVIAGDIKPSEVGALHVNGVFKIPKKVASTAFTFGAEVSFDDGIIAKTTGKTSAGWVVIASEAGETDVAVKLLG